MTCSSEGTPRVGRMVLALGVAWAAVAAACGPYFPNRLLLQPDRVALTMPAAAFVREIAAIGVRPKHALQAHEAGDPARATGEADLADLRAAQVPEATVAQVAAFREALRHGAAAQVVVPAGLPDEVRLYLEGARSFHAGGGDGGRGAWQALLDLPEGQRRRRSVWAAYMLGRTSVPAEASRWYATARDLAARGFEDRLGLAVASLGEEGRSLGERGDVAGQIEAYLQQSAYDSGSALSSLQLVARDVLSTGNPAVLQKLAAAEHPRRVLTAYLLSRRVANSDGDARPTTAVDQRWIAALEAARVTDLPAADRLAWLAYRHGRYRLARRWLARSRRPSAVGHWVRAKLALRDGRLDRAATHLRAVIRGFPEKEAWPLWPPDAGSYGTDDSELRPAARARAELGLIHLRRGELTQAAEALFRSGYWLDAAYVAERVLTAAELQRFVDRVAPPRPVRAPDSRSPRELATAPAIAPRSQSDAQRLRALLGRRLVRAGKPTEALPYLAPAQRPAAERYAAALREGRDARRPAEARTRALWRAARLARTHGLELMGTELDPDWAVFDGNFELGDTPRARAALEDRRMAPTKAELKRATAHAPQPLNRFHYRYRAADLALEASALRPEDDPLAASLLCEAGRWLMYQNPAAALRYYKEMMNRHGQTPLSQATRRGQWFPASATGCGAPE